MTGWQPNMARENRHESFAGDLLDRWGFPPWKLKEFASRTDIDSVFSDLEDSLFYIASAQTAVRNAGQVSRTAILEVLRGVLKGLPNTFRYELYKYLLKGNYRFARAKITYFHWENREWWYVSDAVNYAIVTRLRPWLKKSIQMLEPESADERFPDLRETIFQSFPFSRESYMALKRRWELEWSRLIRDLRLAGVDWKAISETTDREDEPTGRTTDDSNKTDGWSAWKTKKQIASELKPKFGCWRTIKRKLKEDPEFSVELKGHPTHPNWARYRFRNLGK